MTSMRWSKQRHARRRGPTDLVYAYLHLPDGNRFWFLTATTQTLAARLRADNDNLQYAQFGRWAYTTRKAALADQRAIASHFHHLSYRGPRLLESTGDSHLYVEDLRPLGMHLSGLPVKWRDPHPYGLLRHTHPDPDVEAAT